MTLEWKLVTQDISSGNFVLTENWNLKPGWTTVTLHMYLSLVTTHGYSSDQRLAPRPVCRSRLRCRSEPHSDTPGSVIISGHSCALQLRQKFSFQVLNEYWNIQKDFLQVKYLLKLTWILTFIKDFGAIWSRTWLED